MNCLYCGAETTNGLALCELCQAALLVRLEWVPVHFRNLARLKSAPRLNASMPRWSPGRGEDEQPAKRRDGGLVMIGNALSTAHADLTGWARALEDDRPHLADAIDPMLTDDEAPFVTAFCHLLTENVATLTTLPWSGELLRGLERMEKRLGRLSDDWVPGWYAGRCTTCQTPCYVEPGVTWVTCSGCGKTTAASDHIDTVLAEASDWTARAKGTTKKPGIAEVVVALTRESSVERISNLIRQWSKRGQIIACVYVDSDGDPSAKRYRLGDVLDRLRVDGANQVDNPERISA